MMAFITNILRCCLFQAVLISLWMDVISGFGIQLVPQYPQVGQNVTLIVTGIKGTIKSFTWYKGETADNDNQIFFNINNSIALGAQNFSRANGLPNASLHISDLKKADQANYTVTVQAMIKSEATILLLVYDSTQNPNEANTSGQTIGIVVAVVLLVIVLVIALIYLLVIRRRNTKTTAPNSNTSASGVVENDRTTIPGIQMAEHEIQYSSLEFAGRGQRMKPDPEPTMYAEVRRT
ncbi:carcinoembryonic antigen-related cell adhesion molecule 19-like [Bombina bombina]|uniref:carcinoembryonic antigen-related cell adhesion molecule 19-like n=1 Tax=Bombina bombina TaxID=8345 RepID=UPI00235A7925|nr:carcinoembryonic antigen-related cell adhesion molecule 19-like [Bombina bombina]